MSVLIVACPCAVALAGPLVTARVLAGCGRQGVWIRDAGVIQRLAAVQVALLDKTGTLTAGEPRVVDELWTGDDAENSAISHATAVLESASRHPIAQAIARHLQPGAPALDAHARPTPDVSVLDVRGGLAGNVDGVRVAVVGPAAVQDRGAVHVSVAAQAFMDRHRTAGSTLACVVAQGAAPHVAAVFALCDHLRPGAAGAVAALRSNGIQPRLLSGDHATAVKAVADAVGIEQHRADASPADKRAAVHEAGPESTMMVGDGFNDIAALSLAAVSVTVDTAPPLAIETADVVLAASGLPGIAHLLARAARARVAARVAVGWALLYNALGVGLAVAGLITPLLAAVLMPLSSLTVVLVATVMTRDSAMPNKGEKVG